MNKDKLLPQISQRDNWYWPTQDTDCWAFMHNHAVNLPDIVSEYVKEKGVVVQAGGNAGYYIRRYAELYDVVYTFEPQPESFLCLTLNCDTSNVVKFQACVGDKPGFLSLDHHGHDIGATHVSGKGIFPTMRIDDLKLERCDLLQLDTEGFEYFGLLGAKETIEKFKPVLCVEWYTTWAARYGITLDMVESFIFQFGYKLVKQYVSDRIYIVE